MYTHSSAYDISDTYTHTPKCLRIWIGNLAAYIEFIWKIDILESAPAAEVVASCGINGMTSI